MINLTLDHGTVKTIPAANFFICKSFANHYSHKFRNKLLPVALQVQYVYGDLQVISDERLLIIAIVL